MEQKSRPGSVTQVEITKVLCSFANQFFLFVFPTPQTSGRNITITKQLFYGELAQAKRKIGGGGAGEVLYGKPEGPPTYLKDFP